MRGVAVLTLVVALVSAGCLAGMPEPDDLDTAGGNDNGTAPANPAEPGDDDGGTTTPPPAPPVDGNMTTPPTPGTGGGHAVVAVVDSGINPYHEDFRVPVTGQPSARIPGFPTHAVPIRLTFDAPYGEAVKADAPVWDNVQEGTLYTVPGTRIVGAITFGDLGTLNAPSSSLILDDVGHGTGVASMVAKTAPHADIVMVQVGAASLGDGIAWAAAQPWIDVVSVSWGTLANAPTNLFGSATVDALEAAAASGKLVTVAAGNEPSLALTGLSGHPAVISVGGSSPDGRGETWTAGKGVDVVSDFSPVAATHTSVDGTDEVYGTSFATPIVAGALAEAWYLARAAGVPVDAATLRSAMNLTASYYDATDYAANTMEVPVVAPWVQMGWGYLGASHAETIAKVAMGVEPPQDKPMAAMFMMAYQDARETAW